MTTKQFLALYRWRSPAGELMDTVDIITATSLVEAKRTAKTREGEDGHTWLHFVERQEAPHESLRTAER